MYSFLTCLLYTSVLTVEVSFKSTSHEITYSVDGKGGTLTAVNENDKKIDSGTKITQGSKVTFTAKPEDGYIVSGWQVDGKPYKWQDKDENYLGTTLVLEDVYKRQSLLIISSIHRATTLITKIVSMKRLYHMRKNLKRNDNLLSL